MKRSRHDSREGAYEMDSKEHSEVEKRATEKMVYESKKRRDENRSDKRQRAIDQCFR